MDLDETNDLRSPIGTAEDRIVVAPVQVQGADERQYVDQAGSSTGGRRFFVEVLQAEGDLRLLGTVLSLVDVTGREIQHRVSSSWRLFWSMKPLLLNERTSIRKRLRLFDTTVASCALWCCESWTPRAAELQQLESARRSMLRKIVRTNRAPDEQWIDWTIRATHKALAVAGRFGIRDWRNWHYQRKWTWAGHVVRQCVLSWLYRTTAWRSAAWQQINADLGSARLFRPANWCRMRWEDTIHAFCRDWHALAQHREQWANRTSEFVRAHTL